MNKEMSITDVYDLFPTEEDCLKHLEKIRWGGETVCPYCNAKNITTIKNINHSYQSHHCNTCNRSFSVTVKTIFHKTKVPLRKWFVAISLMLNARKSLSSHQLSRDISVNRNTGWYMMMRIRKAMDEDVENREYLKGIVEVDETFVGGKNKNRHWDKKVKNSQGRSFKDKVPVIGMIQRANKENGTPKKVIAYSIPNTQANVLKPEIKKHIQPGSIIMSDEWKGYKGLHWKYDHRICDHGKHQYMGENGGTTNTIEGFWSIFKRSLIGQHHSVSRKYLDNYIDECCFKYNHLKYNNVFGILLEKALSA